MALPTDKDALNLAKIENREYLEDRTGGSAASDRRTELLLKILGDMQQNNKINESTVVAERLFAEGFKAGLPMKRVAQAPFFVLRGAAMPAVLLEMGFITNASEAKLLAQPGYQQKIADAMANGVYSYLMQ
jgi:N-acetylmuramoyl-L-alanine amidase